MFTGTLIVLPDVAKLTGGMTPCVMENGDGDGDEDGDGDGDDE